MNLSIRSMSLAALFAALTAVGAFLRLPLGATAVTLQFFFTALAGILLGPQWGAASQAVYVALGLAGLPVFTQGGGLGYLLMPSMGFLLGLIPSAWIVGRLAGERRPPSVVRIIGACVVGLAVLYLVGLPYLYGISHFYLRQEISAWTVISTGMLIYLPGDALKIVATGLLSRPLLRAIPQGRGRAA